MKGKIVSIHPSIRSSVYNYVCEGEEGVFSFPVEFRYHMDILKREGDPTGREVEYMSDNDPPYLIFLDGEEVS